jgi:hypothetical protein
MIKIKFIVMGLSGVVGLMILFGVLTGMVRISVLDSENNDLRGNILEKTNDLGNLELIRYKDEKSEAAICINLSNVDENDITVTNSEINIYLPAPRLCYTSSNENNSSDLSPASSTGLFDQSRVNAKKIILSLMSSMTKKHVQIQFKE